MTGKHDDTPDPPRLKAMPRKPRIDESGRQRLGQNLRHFYASVLNQPLPDRFTQLLDELSGTPTTQEDKEGREGSR